MSFADTILPSTVQELRQRLLFHHLWQRIEDGTLEKERLRIFALQDWLLVREAYRLDALAIANAPDIETQELLIRKLVPKVGGYNYLFTFGDAIGLSRKDFDTAQPLAGCMALTHFFFYTLAYGTPEEKLASVSASEDVFVQICARIGPALMKQYGLSREQVTFFTAHDEIGERVTPVDTTLLARYTSPEQRQRIIETVRLSHEYELMFYDTVLYAPLS